MNISRRTLLRASAAGGALLSLRPALAWAAGQSPALAKFIQPLPGLGPTGIPVAVPKEIRQYGQQVDFYEIEMGQFEQSVHPDLPPTRFWGYADVTRGDGHPNHRYLGGVIVANRGRPVLLRAKNRLPDRHILPIDRTLMGAEGADNRATVHLHGGFVAWLHDGGPHSWFTPKGKVGKAGTSGPSFLNDGPSTGSADYWYPNDQSSRLVWYHDHALGITRLNAYAGLASAYVLRDEVEASLIFADLLPRAEIPLVIQDKTFLDQQILDGNGAQPPYPVTSARVGDLFYPFLYDAELNPGGKPLPPISCVPEFFGDTMLVNGAAYPYLDIEPRHYRFRILNGAQARFLNLQLYFARNDDPAQPDLGRPGPAFVQVGTEGGFLPAPVLLNDPPLPFTHPGFFPGQYNLMLAPAERADLVIDFSSVPPGSRLILWHDAPTPFPDGDPADPLAQSLLQLRVGPRVGAADGPQLGLLEAIARGAETQQVLPPVPGFDPGTAVKVRDLTLNEGFDDYGRLLQQLGTTEATGTDSFGRAYDDAPTETPTAGTVEIWNIFNLTADTHPIHFHLVNVQVLCRSLFDPVTFARGPGRPPDPNELGFKETVRMHPGECTTVIAKFDLPRVPFPIPPSPRTGGHEYVWHCHILEHEEHDMMRPLVVKD